MVRIRPSANGSGRGYQEAVQRDPQSNLFLHRDRGFLPEGLLNYLALLGWSIADDRDLFTPNEMVRAFDVIDVNSNPARFDQKADAINAEHIRRLEPAEFATRLRAYFGAQGYDTGLDEAAFGTAAELVQTRIVVLSDAWELLKFLNDDCYVIDPKAGAKELAGDAASVLDFTSLRSNRWPTGPPRRSRSAQRRADRWPGTRRARRSGPSGSRLPALPLARRCSSRWSCSAATAVWGACARPAMERSGIFGSLLSGVLKARNCWF